MKSPKAIKDKLSGDSPKPHPSIDSTSDIGSPCSDITGFSSDHATPTSPPLLKAEDGKDSPLLGITGDNANSDDNKLEANNDENAFPPTLIRKTSVLVNPTNVVAPSGVTNSNKYPSVASSNNMFLPPPTMSNYSTPRGYYEGDMWGIPPYDLGSYPPTMGYPMGSTAGSPGVMNNFNFSSTPSNYPHTIGYTGKSSATSPWQPGGSYSPHHMMSPTTPSNGSYGNSSYSPGGSPYAAPSLPPVMISPLLSRSNATGGLF